MEEKVPIKKKVGRPKKNTKESPDTHKTTTSDTDSPKMTISTNSATLATTQKKRGRKPKVLTEPVDNTIVKIPSKRGRKPKEKPEEDTVKIPKRRGRKPKDKSYGVLPSIKKDIGSENIIIHLPIKPNSIKNNLKETELLTYNPNINNPLPYESSIGGHMVDNTQFISQQNNPNNENELKGAGPPPNSNFCQYPFDEKSKTIFEVLEDNTETKSEDSAENMNKLSSEFNIEHMKDWYNENEIEQGNFKHNGLGEIIDVIKSTREKEKASYLSKNNKSNVEKCLIQFVEANKNDSWPSSTSVYCWWCCHPFDGPPCSLPCDYNNNVFRVCGIFCSPECAAAYNFNDIHSGYDLWERYSLLNFLYRKIYNDNHIKIKLAPPKQTLRIFGGNLSIKDFRIHNTNYNSLYKVVMPPLISITPVQELTSVDHGYSSKNEKKVFMIEKDKINDSNLKLQRSKPFNTSKNTLEKCMLQSRQSIDSESMMSNNDNEIDLYDD